MSKSKSKTFPKGTDMGEVVDWLYEQVKTTDHEVIYPSETDSKYLITITKLPEKEKE